MDQNSNSIRKHSQLTESSTVSNPNLVSGQEVEMHRGGSKLKMLLRNITIEPVMFMQMFGFGLVMVITQNLYIERICRVKLDYSEEICENLTLNHDSEDISNDMRVRVDGLASQFTLYRSIAEAATQIVVALFLGSWSDKHGNKIPLLLPVVGYFLQSVLNTLFTFLPDLPPEYLLISSVPIALSGGLASIVLSAFSYIASVTTKETRSYRIAFMEASWMFGNPMGLIVGARIYKVWGFRGVYITSAVLNLLAVIYGIIFIQDKKVKFDKLSTCCTDLFNVSAVKDTFYTVFKKRDGRKRMWILMLVVAVAFRIGTLFGPQNCLFLFTRYMFQWNEQQYSLLATLEGVAHVVGSFIMTVICIQFFKLSDPLVGILSSIGLLVANLAVGFVPKDPDYSWVMYLALVLQMFTMMATIVIRSMLSKMAPQEELGKLFTFVACGEITMPVVGGAIYSVIFTHTEKHFPGAFSLLSFAVNLLILINFIYFFILMRKNPQVLLHKSEDQKDKEKSTDT